MGGAAFAVAGCGGGGSSSASTASTQGLSLSVTPVVPPAPVVPPPPPPPVQTLKGVTIDQAEADIRATVKSYADWFAKSRTFEPVVTVKDADTLQAAINAIYKSPLGLEALARNHRIECAWNGSSMMAGGPLARITVGASQMETSFYDRGGSLVIAAAANCKPGIANTVFIATRGVMLQGLGFTRKAQAGETPAAVGAVIIQTTAKFQPLKVIAQFNDCAFGTFDNIAANSPTEWVDGLKTAGGETEFVGFARSSFCGLQTALKLTSRNAVVNDCDFRQCLGDGIDLYGHVYAADYIANAVIEKTTFRNWGDTWESRDFHADAVQTGAPSDIHKGYRVVMTDSVAHMVRRFGGSDGKGGGPQGFFNAATPNADNQFVVRRCIFLVTATHGFAYYSPNATRPSFVDHCTFMRAGVIPSGFAPDKTLQDTLVVVSVVGAEPAGGPWLLVTDSIAKNGFKPTQATTSIVECDPRSPLFAPEAQRPEKLFTGRDFGRANAAANNLSGKFGYSLPNEATSRSWFVADVWANFQPTEAVGTAGAPDPRVMAWTN